MALGITSFKRYVAHISQLNPAPSLPIPTTINLTKLQRNKLYLHKCCAHKGFEKLKKWILEWRFKDIDPASGVCDT
jgi:hypothetical protein